MTAPMKTWVERTVRCEASGRTCRVGLTWTGDTTKTGPAVWCSCERAGADARAVVTSLTTMGAVTCLGAATLARARLKKADPGYLRVGEAGVWKEALDGAARWAVKRRTEERAPGRPEDPPSRGERWTAVLNEPFARAVRKRGPKKMVGYSDQRVEQAVDEVVRNLKVRATTENRSLHLGGTLAMQWSNRAMGRGMVHPHVDWLVGFIVKANSKNLCVVCHKTHSSPREHAQTKAHRDACVRVLMEAFGGLKLFTGAVVDWSVADMPEPEPTYRGRRNRGRFR